MPTVYQDIIVRFRTEMSKATTSFKNLHTLSKQVGGGMMTTAADLDYMGLKLNSAGKLIDKNTGRFVEHDKAMGNLRKSAKRFRMEYLSVMFLGMNLQRTFQGLTRTSMEWMGVMEVQGAILGVMFLPLAEWTLSILLWLWDAWNNLPEPIKDFINVLVGGAIVLGGFLATIFGLKLGLAGLAKVLAPAFWAGIKGYFVAIWGAISGAVSAAAAAIGVSVGVMLGIIVAIIAAIVLFVLAWKNNWGHIRQHTGNFLKWFAGIFDTWIKPVFSLIGTGIIALAYGFITSIKNMGAYWSLIWNGMKLAAFTIWNGIVTGIEWLGNKVIDFVNTLIKARNWLGKKVGWEQWEELPEWNLDKLKASTDDAKEAIKTALEDIKKNGEEGFEGMKDAIDSWNNTLDSVAPKITEIGDKFIEQGNAIDSGIKKQEKLVDTTSYVNAEMDDMKNSIGDVSTSLNESTKDWTIYENNVSTSMSNIGTTIQTGSETWKTHSEDVKEKTTDMKTHIDLMTESVNGYAESLKSIPEFVRTTIEETRIVKTMWGGFGFSFFQHGGIVTRPQLGVVGEAGQEAIIPLSKLSEMGNNVTIENPTIHISSIVGRDSTETIVREVIDKLGTRLVRVI